MIGWSMVIVAWQLLTNVGLVVLGKTQTWWIATHNRYYLAHHGKLDYPFPPNPPDLSHAPIKVRPTLVSWEASCPKPPFAPDWAVHNENETSEQKLSRRRLFPELSGEDRQWFAIGNGETVLAFSAQGLQNVYSDEYTRYCILSENMGYMPIPLPIPEIQAKARAVGPGGQPAHASFNLAPDRRSLGETDFYFLPVAATGLVYVFVEFEHRVHQLKEMDIPESSRWDIFGFSYKKNFHGPAYGNMTTTNRYGYRSEDLAVPKPKNVFRILCLGGSTTYEGMDNAHTYPALLQQELRALFPDKRIEVMNCGVEGMNSRSNFLHAPEYLELEPDLVISYLGVNDTQNDVQIMCQAGLSPWYHLIARWEFLQRNCALPFWPSDDVIESRLRAVTITHIEGLRRIFARHGIRFALSSLAYVPYDSISREKRADVDMESGFTGAIFAKLVSLLNPEIKTYCEQQGLLYIPVCENITDPDWLVDPCHLSQQGIALKAHVIAESLKDYIAPALEKNEDPKH
jgi:lysophospholipase L1-like esterase